MDDIYRLSYWDKAKTSNKQPEPDAPENPDSNKIEELKRWSSENLRTIILPTNDLQDLERQWAEFNGMHKKLRRESDWKSIEVFGMTNKTHYDLIRSKLLMEDIPDDLVYDTLFRIGPGDQPVLESYINYDRYDIDYYNTDVVSYTSLDVENAIKWSEESNRVIIIPTRTLEELEDLWTKYNEMIKKHRRESDWTSLEFFGVTNLKHYEYLKSQFLKEDIDNKREYYEVDNIVEGVNMGKYFLDTLKNESVIDSVQAVLESVRPRNDVAEDALSGVVLSDVLDGSDGLSAPTYAVELPYGDMPFFNPDEMIDMGVFGQADADNFYGAIADNSMLTDEVTVKEWFEAYKNYTKGFYNEFTSLAAAWLDKVRVLQYQYNRMKENATESELNAKRQSILELGWNPDVELNSKSRKLTRLMLREYMDRDNRAYRVIDLKGFECPESEAISESLSEKDYLPVYVVLTQGKSLVSKPIMKITRSDYSHASLSFDPMLHSMYSYNMDNRVNKVGRGGFKIEDINKDMVGLKIAVFVFFVSKDIYCKLCDTVNYYRDHVEDTGYSWLNLFLNAFRIPFDRDMKLICSEFVDKVLKSVDIRLSNKPSSIVTPAMIYNKAVDEDRIYCVFEDETFKYNGNKVERLVNALKSKAVALKEEKAIFNDTEYVQQILSNIHNIPKLYALENSLHFISNQQLRQFLENSLFDPITIRPICEAKPVPIQFDAKGNLIIKRGKKIDYASEYAQSHKLLKEYDKAKNIEGMKYEVAKLWMMLCMIEETLNSDKFQDLPSFAIETSAEARNKGNINNDFQYYLKKIMEVEPKFNFTLYYEESPFNYKAIQVNATTITAMTSLIKNILKPMRS